ncbi:helix-turn-helix domain-containing protein [Streptomyces sp. ST2-7A]|uniref:helix-turn-helix domain-containing protein n=1 Tax=Streptomyces sp. ST2-7A TaxID=2907214 RepID=UPI001F2DD898|nr:helix-turn-helix domain-containing protein [Streptomyces sp. ST2-7A]MCE7082803.1 helix-turn-helix domain-containing protein [Streptomyces sp. ST2-7A]
MTSSQWKTHGVKQLLGQTVEYDQEYVDARLAGDLGQAVYDRRVELGLSQTEPAERAAMTQPQISRIEGGDTVPTLPLLRRLAKALDGSLNVALTADDSRVTFTPHAA